jgi:hypothetical protein
VRESYAEEREIHGYTDGYAYMGKRQKFVIDKGRHFCSVFWDQSKSPWVWVIKHRWNAREMTMEQAMPHTPLSQS